MHYRNHPSYCASWLKQIPWQVFATLTFAQRVGDEFAVQSFEVFVDVLERHFRCPLTYVRGDERRLGGPRLPPIPRHFHVLFAAAVSLDCTFIRNSWIPSAGNPKGITAADVRIYDPHRGALPYSLKQICDPDGDWSLANVDLYLYTPGADSRARARRRQSRQAKRLAGSDHRSAANSQM